MTGRVRIAVGAISVERDAPVTTVVLTDVPEGTHRVTLAANRGDGTPIADENVVQVTPGSVADVQLAIPAI